MVRLAWLRYWYVYDFELEIWTLVGNDTCFTSLGNIVSLCVRHFEIR
jgi:hypothetical protein